MSEPLHEPLHPELAALFAAERAAPVAGTATRTAVRAKLAAAVGKAPLGTAVGGTLGTLGKVIAIVAVTVGAGTIAVEQRTGPRATPPRIEAVAPSADTEIETDHVRVVAADVVVVAPDILDVARAQTRASRPVVAIEPVPPAPPPVHEPAPPAAPSQAELLRQAWTALAAGDAAHALELVAHDRELHGDDGPLAEEGEALEVQALGRLGRLADARRAAARFIARYPDSVHRALVERAARVQVSRKETP